jgi:hypothetical protein
MSDTEVIERALNLVLENTVLCASYGGVFRAAAVELAELKQRAALVDEDGCANILSEFSAMRTENDKLRTDLGLIYSAVGTKTPTDTLVTIGKTQVALDEARKVVGSLLQFLDDNGWGAKECCCSEGEDDIGMGAVECEYHEGKRFLKAHPK